MAGTLFSLALSQRFDREGELLINAPLYIYEANTTTPVDVYQDFGLSVLHQWPMRTDTAGMIPAFWLPDGQYRARLTDEAGAVVYFDMASVQALGPSTGEGGGGGGSVDPNAVFQTGDELWVKRAGTRAGWVRQNGRTIGSASSGATERANADTQPLYEYLWNNFSNALCPVTGGRGGSASADYAANKPIALPDMRGYGPLGLDDMGNTAAGRITAGTPTTAGTGGGAEKISITITKESLPNYELPDTLVLTGTPTGLARNLANAGSGSPYGTPAANRDKTWTTTNLGLDGSVTLGGGGQAIEKNTMSPYRLGTWFLKL